MIIKNISFKNMNEITKFVNIASKYDFDIDIRKGVIVLDAKSIQGLYNLQLGDKLECIINDNSTDADNFIKSIEEFEVQ